MFNTSVVFKESCFDSQIGKSVLTERIYDIPFSRSTTVALLP